MIKSYKNQILNHNVEKFSLIIRDDRYMLSFIKTLIEANKNAALQINCVNDAKKITKDFKYYV